MKKHIRNSGFAAVCLGALMLIAGYALGWTDSNAYLLSAAALVVAGTVTHIYFIKKESRCIMEKTKGELLHSQS